MKISIITATYNSATTISDTIESVLSQNYSDFEHIIVDGASKDGTLDIVRSYEPRYAGRLRYISGKDKGIYDAMNKGIAMATGDIIGILNSDDFYADSHVLQLISDAFVNDGSLGCVYGNLVFVNAKETDKIERHWHGSSYTHRGFLRGWHPAHPTFYAKREAFEQYGVFDTSFDVSADFELMFRFMEKHSLKGKFIDHTFVKMRMGGESTGSISKIIQGNKNVIRAFKKNGFEVPRFYIIKRIAPKAISFLKTKLKL